MSANKLHSFLTGDVLEPGSARYEEARRVWNAGIDRRPKLIVQAHTPADIVTAIKYGRDEQLVIAVRAGGHSAAGHGVCEGGLVIDLTRMNGVKVDLAAGRVRVGGGALLRDLDQATQAHGLAVPSGHVSHTGVGGLTLGGGTGWMMRKLGLSVDSLECVEMVTAAGQVLSVSAKEHPDLFWALRGGGGNFGVVTEFTFRPHKVGPMVLAGALVYPLDEAAAVMRFNREFMREAPDELTIANLFRIAPPAPPFGALAGKPALFVVICYCGDLNAGERVVAPLRAFGKPINLLRPMPYLALQTSIDELTAFGAHAYMTSSFMNDLDDAMIEALIEQGRMLPTEHTVF
ncbi:MAG: FAD-binding oxidoreductase, partial [Steroidobacteraceae bacterium]